MTVYWTSTKAPRHLFKREYESPEAAAFIRENASVDPSILVADLGIGAPTIRAYQRRLGVRKLTGNAGRAT